MEKKGSALILLLASPIALASLSIGVPKLVALIAFLLGFSLPVVFALALALVFFGGIALAG